MKISQQLLKDANITPKLRLGQKSAKGVVSTGPHRVRIVKDKLDTGIDHKGSEIEVVKYLVLEGDTHKYYTVPKLGKDGELHYLVQRLAEVPEEAEVILEMKKIGAKNYVSVIELGKGETTVEYGDDDIDAVMGQHDIELGNEDRGAE